MADKSAKDKDGAKAADGEPKKPLNKQTAKVMQDGVELTWDVQREGDPDPEAAAKFYAQSVEALRKFKDLDPRTMPALRAADKKKKDFWKAIANLFWGLVIGMLLMVVFGPHNCADSSRPRYRRSYDD